MSKVTVVVPVFNEAEGLRRLYDKVRDIAAGLKESTFSWIFVNDGSTDASLEVIRDLAEQDSTVKYISFSRCFGKETAIYAGDADNAAHTPGEPQKENEVAATCRQEGGYDLVIRCTTPGCGHLLSSEHHTIPHADHTPGEPGKENEAEATCLQHASYDLVTRCTECITACRGDFFPCEDR